MASTFQFYNRDYSSDLQAPLSNYPLRKLHHDADTNTAASMSGAAEGHARNKPPSLNTDNQHHINGDNCAFSSEEDQNSTPLLARADREEEDDDEDEDEDDDGISSHLSTVHREEQLEDFSENSSNEQVGVMESGRAHSQDVGCEMRPSVSGVPSSLSDHSFDDEELLQHNRQSEQTQRFHTSDAPCNYRGTMPTSGSKTATWLPYTLRKPFLCLLTVSAITLLLTVVLLCSLSVNNDGLGVDDGSSILLFGWRFTPSLLAVLYVQLTAMLLDDVKRTECFAQLAKSGGAPAVSSILRAPGAWWDALANSLPKRNNGQISWLLLSSAFINILGFLIISPLSSSFLVSTEATVTKEVKFDRTTPQLPVNLTSGRDTKLRIFGHLLQNVTTSAWILDDYTIFPFWPSRMENPPLGPLLSDSPQKWQADTLVLSTELECEPVHLINYNTTGYDVITVSGSGCTSELHSNGTSIAGCNWYIPFTFMGTDLLALNQSKMCGERELLFITPEPGVEVDRSQFIGYSCTANYYMAELEVTANTSSGSSDMTFDVEEYRKRRSRISETFLNVSLAQEMSLSREWSDYLPDHSGSAFGAGSIVGALYNFDISAMNDGNTLIARAGKVKRRMFGEIVQDSLQRQNAPTETVSGKVTNVQKRVMVTPGVAIILIVTLSVSLVLQSVVWIYSNLRVRPLNLSEDPASAASIATLIPPDSTTHMGIRTLKLESTTNVYQSLREKQYYTEQHTLYESRKSVINSPAKKKKEITKSSWSPPILRLRVMSALTVFLCALTAAIIVLHSLSQRSQLYRTAFVYQARFSFFGVRTIEPFLVIPTLLAVAVGLWWGAMDTTFRRLQPYISMAQAPPKRFTHGLDLSYQSSYWSYATYKAASRRHWFLLLVTIGTSLSPVLTIAMSALFQRVRSNYSHIVPAERGLEMRTIPFLYEGNYVMTGLWAGRNEISIIADLYTNLSTNWIYSATLELTMNGSQPPWSRDGWSFVPFQLGQFENNSLIQDAIESSGGPATNVSVTTPAIRGRIDCSPFANLDNTSAWLATWNLGNSSEWNSTSVPHNITSAYEPGFRDSEGYMSAQFFNTVFLADGSRPVCCGNGTDWPPKSSVFGNWSPFQTDENYIIRQPFNFAMKWVYGNLITGVRSVKNHYGYPELDRTKEHVMFLEVPLAQALECTPIIEESLASVTVDRRSGQVIDFAIEEEPMNTTEAWTDVFIGSGDGPDYNITVSYGVLFINSLLRSANLRGYEGNIQQANSGAYEEKLEDRTFNIRDTERGLNLDLMTYAMYSLVDKDPLALLDAKTMEATAQKTFTTFFQHFVSSNVLFETGGWAYQPINYTLPQCLWNFTGPSTCKDPIRWPISHTNRTTTAEISTEIVLLKTNPAAVWLSVAILVWLIATTLVIAAVQRRYLKNLKGDVACVADTLALVGGSDKLLKLLQDRREGRFEENGAIKTRLGWFKDRDGQSRWGIEVVDCEDSGST